MLPLEIVRMIFEYAFYPHEMPYNEVAKYNMCVNQLPRKERINHYLYMYYKLQAGNTNPWYYGNRSYFYYDPKLSPYVNFDYQVTYLGRTWTIEECTNCKKTDFEYYNSL